MNLLSSVKKIHNSKLFFSKGELSKILSCYSLGVSKGNWKDYAISFTKNEASFYMFKHSLSQPDCILTKTNKFKKNKFIYNLKIHNRKKTIFTEIDNLLALIKRRDFKII